MLSQVRKQYWIINGNLQQERLSSIVYLAEGTGVKPVSRRWLIYQVKDLSQTCHHSQTQAMTILVRFRWVEGGAQ